jgi:hypothetical protein
MTEDLFTKSFDHLLAFVLTGMVALWGYVYFDPNGVGAWFKNASATETTVNGVLFLLLAALGVGVFISGVRWLLLQRAFRLFPAPPNFDEKRRRNPDIHAAVADYRHNH